MKIDSNTYKLTDDKKLKSKFFILGLLFSFLSILGYVNNEQQFFHSYLVSFVFWITIALGAMFFVLISYVMNATWSVVLRRIAENLMKTLPLMFLLFIPILIGLEHIYHWMDHHHLDHDKLLQWKEPFLNQNFFVIRSILYFLIWIFISHKLYNYSINLKNDNDVISLRKISAASILIFALSVSFAGFDWLMTLDPHWYSTMFGVYIFSGSFLSAVTFIIIFSLYLRNQGILVNEINIEHYHDLGRIAFGFVVFWSYIAGFQYYLIWYANIPEEIKWYLHRWVGTWKEFSMIIVFCHFIIPFFVLIFHNAKRNLSILGIVAFMLLSVHWMDLHWNVMPGIHKYNVVFDWSDVTTFIAIGGFFMSVFWHYLTKNPIIPDSDPRIKNSINGEY